MRQERGTQRDTRARSGEDRGRDGSDGARSQGMPWTVEDGRGREGFSHRAFGGSAALLTP